MSYQDSVNKDLVAEESNSIQIKPHSNPILSRYSQKSSGGAENIDHAEKPNLLQYFSIYVPESFESVDPGSDVCDAFGRTARRDGEGGDGDDG